MEYYDTADQLLTIDAQNYIVDDAGSYAIIRFKEGYGVEWNHDRFYPVRATYTHGALVDNPHDETVKGCIKQLVRVMYDERSENIPGAQAIIERRLSAIQRSFAGIAG